MKPDSISRCMQVTSNSGKYDYPRVVAASVDSRMYQIQYSTILSVP